MNALLSFAPAFCGGLLIGAAAALLLLVNGRIAGVSGQLAQAFHVGVNFSSGALAFVIGLPLGAALMQLLRPNPPIDISYSVPLLIAAGLLVGFGTRLGNGCTSGHGVCGLARLSPRSLAATTVFMLSGAVTVFIIRHVMGG